MPSSVVLATTDVDEFRAKQGIGGQRVWILGTQAVRRLLQELFEESPSDTLRRVRA